MKKNKDKSGFGNGLLEISTLNENPLTESSLKDKSNKTSYNKILIPIFGLMLFSLLVSTSAFAAKDFIVENRTSALFIINGTTGNVILTPSFGMVGIGTINPINALTVIGSVSAFGSLNATFINATEIRIGNSLVPINGAFNNGNYTSLEDSAFRIVNFTTQLNNYIPSFFNNENFTNLKPFTLTNYSAEYALSGFKIINFTSEYAASGFKIANYTALENAAFTNTNYSNLNNSLWNLSRNLFVYLKDANYLVRIGDVNRNISNDTFAVIGSAAVYGSLNSTSFNSSFILQNNNQVQTINAVFNNVNYTALENAAFTNTNYTNLEAAAFNKANYSSEYASTGFKNANYTSLEDSAFRIANFTTNYEAQAYFKIANYTALENAAFNLVNYSAEYASSGYKLANFTSNLNAQNGSLWNRSSASTYLRFIDDLIGIGTITPDNRLTIRGTDADANLAGQPGLLHLNITDSYNKSVTNLITLDHNLNNPANSTGGIGIGILFRAVNNDSELVNVSFINASLVNAINGSEASALSFYTRAANGLLTPKLILNGSDVYIAPTSGNVGIGTTGPGAALDVVGTGRFSSTATFGVTTSNLKILSGGSNVFIDSSADPTNANIFVSQAGAGDFNSEAGHLILQPRVQGTVYRDIIFASGVANADAIMTIQGEGSVGIGTTGPAATLHSNGTFIHQSASNSTTTFQVKSKEGTTVLDVDTSNRYVGIGLTAPTATLHVRSEDRANNSMIVWERDDGLVQGALGYSDSNSNNVFIGSKTNHPLILRTNSVARGAIDTNGMFGINTTSPSDTLHVVGTSRLFGTSGTGLFVDKSSNVGIGTTAPTSKLHISTTDDAGGLFRVEDDDTGPATNVAVANFTRRNNIAGGGSTANALVLISDHSLNVPLFIRADDTGSALFIVNGSGNVGIGTTGPGYKLDVQGTATDYEGIRILNTNNAAGTITSSGIVLSATNSVGQIHGKIAVVEYGSADAADSALAFYTGTGTGATPTEKMRIINNGNVGIGTKNPRSLLQVNGSNNPTITIGEESTGNRSTLQFRSGMGAASYNSFDITYNKSTDTDQLTFVGGGANQIMTIQNGGNVGIGTTGPGALLQVGDNAATTDNKIIKIAADNTIADPRIILSVNGITDWAVGVDNSDSNKFKISGDSTVPGTNDRLTIDTSGNVGIGTTGPGNKLSVSGDINATTGSLYWGDGTRVGVASYSVGDDSAYIGSLSNSNFSIRTNNANRIFIQSGGNVGIGTTSPTSKLTVAGDVNISSGSLYLSGGGDIVGLSGNTQSLIGASVWSVGNGVSNPTFRARGRTELGIDSGDVVMVNGGGNVGIGTTGPAQKLHINGTGAGTGVRLRIDNYASAAADTGIQLEFRGVSSNQLGTVTSAWEGGDTTASYMSFGTYGSGALTDKVRITSAGNVGIGTTVPPHSLTINGGGIMINRSSAPFVLFTTNLVNTAQVKAFTPDTMAITEGTGATSYFNVNTSSGNVGIGTTGPGQKLDVRGHANFQLDDVYIALNSPSASRVWLLANGVTAGDGKFVIYDQTAASHRLVINTAGNVGIGTTGPRDALTVETGAGTDTNLSLGAYANDNNVNIQAAGGLRFALDQDNDQTGRAFQFMNNGASGTELMRIDENGNVGIGTTTPASTLTITGNFSATGTKSAVVNTSYGMRKLYAIESPDVSFYDRGRASLANGIANISLDPIFIETVEPDYQVFLTPEADTAGIYVAEKAKEYFIVKGRNKNSNIPFSWLLSALRKGYKETRLDSERKENTEIIAVIDEENKVTDVNIINNLNNIQNVNASGENKTQSTNAITGNAINEITKPNNEKSANENKFAVASNKEDEIINKISEKTNLDKEAVKKAITFKRKEPKKEKFEQEIFEAESQAAAQVYPPGYSKVNGSVIIKLG